MPSVRGIQIARLRDKAFDAAIWQAQAIGIQLRLEDGHQELVGAKTVAEVSRARELLHDARAMASKLVAPLNDKLRIEQAGEVVFRWQRPDEGSPKVGGPLPRATFIDGDVIDVETVDPEGD
jgi:hypothetical protein